MPGDPSFCAREAAENTDQSQHFNLPTGSELEKLEEYQLFILKSGYHASDLSNPSPACLVGDSNVLLLLLSHEGQ